MEFLSDLVAFLSDLIVNVGGLIEGLLSSIGLGEPLVSLLMTFISALAVSFFPLMVVIFLIWELRKVSARIGGRLGPNSSGTWAGPWGVVQPFADVIKMFTKEDVRPEGIDPVPYNLAPVLVVFASLMIWAVVPFGPGRELIGADLNVGIFYVLAFSSAALVVFLMAGWSSNNKYATVGAFRAVAQLLGYEIPQLLSVLTVVMVTGSLSMQDIVGGQDVVFLVVLPLSASIFFLSSMAEVNARPFELLEADSELVAGYQVEYSGMKWGVFYLAEFMGAVAVSALFTTIFLGGWRGPWVDRAPFLGTIWFVLKTLLMLLVWIFFQMTLPRLRIDQMLAFNWKFLVPVALVNLCVVGLVDKGMAELFLGETSAWMRAGILCGASLVVAVAAWGVAALRGRRSRQCEASWKATQAGEAEVGA